MAAVVLVAAHTDMPPNLSFKLTLSAKMLARPCRRLLEAFVKSVNTKRDSALLVVDDLKLVGNFGRTVSLNAAIASLFESEVADGGGGPEPAPTMISLRVEPADRLEHVFVVVLQRDAARVAHTERYTRVRLPEAEVVCAVDGADAGAVRAGLSAHGARLSREWALSCRAGQLGCACSHANLWHRVVAEGLPWAVVLEDDVLIADAFRATVRGMLGELPSNDWDWVYLFYHSQQWREPSPQDAGYRYVRAAFPTWGTVAYCVSNRGARRLLARLRAAPMRGPVDELVMSEIEHGRLVAFGPRAMITGTAGQVNPLDDRSRLGSNVWGTPRLDMAVVGASTADDTESGGNDELCAWSRARLEWEAAGHGDAPSRQTAGSLI